MIFLVLASRWFKTILLHPGSGSSQAKAKQTIVKIVAGRSCGETSRHGKPKLHLVRLSIPLPCAAPSFIEEAAASLFPNMALKSSRDSPLFVAPKTWGETLLINLLLSMELDARRLARAHKVRHVHNHALRTLDFSGSLFHPDFPGFCC